VVSGDRSEHQAKILPLSLLLLGGATGEYDLSASASSDFLSSGYPHSLVAYGCFCIAK
jgi:hypothetical protein